MPDYSIFTLGESQLTISGGAQLDGVTQGDGSHLVGQSITLNTDAWTEVQITDNDGNFQDSDASQRLDGAQTVNGISYASGTVVEAEYGLTLSDGVNTWTAIGFNLNDSAPAYGTVEGLAFIGGPGGFPPIGVPLTVTAAQEGPNFAAAAYATPICYDAGTLIDTGAGPRPIEDLRPGDLVRTADDGLQPLRWTGGRHVIGAGRFAPVEIADGAWGATRPLRVSQQHRILIRDPLAELLFARAELFVPAISLTCAPGARLLGGGRCHYHHLVLDRHAVIAANGVASESLSLDDASPEGMSGDLLRFFPDLAARPRDDAGLARPCLRRREADLLIRCIARRDRAQAPAERLRA